MEQNNQRHINYLKKVFENIDQQYLKRLYEPQIPKQADENNTIYNDTLKRNRKQFYTLILCFLAHTLAFLAFENYRKDVYMLTSTTILITLAIIMTVGRNNKKYYELGITILLIAYIPVLTIISDQFLFFSIAATWIIPSIALLLTQNKIPTIGSSIILMFTFHSFYRDTLINKINSYCKVTDNKLEYYFDYQLKLLWIVGILHMASVLNFYGIFQNNQEKLLQTKKGLEMALKNQETFTFSLSHELRNPLNSMIGNLELASQEVSDNNISNMLKTASICGDILLQLINNILDTAKADIGSLEVTLVENNVRETFEKVWAVSREMIRRKGLNGRLFISNKVPSYLQIDPHRLTQILLNLVSNSVKFTQEGEVNIKVKWINEANIIDDKCFEPIPYASDDEGVFEKDEFVENLVGRSILKSENLSGGPSSKNQVSYNNFSTWDVNGGGGGSQENEFDMEVEKSGILKIIVSDTGCGMSEEAMSKLFVKFSQVHAEASKRKVGTGLGLWITRQLCEKMNGQIRVFSQESRGSTFIMCIKTETPQITSPVTNLIKFQKMYSQNRIKDIQRPKIQLSAIVIEDNNQFSGIVSFLNNSGAKIYATVSSCNEALKAYQRALEQGSSINVVTIDLDIYDFNGKECCSLIRQFENQNSILTPATIIILSNHGNQAEIDEFINPRGLNANYYRVKPVTLNDFQEMVWGANYAGLREQNSPDFVIGPREIENEIRPSRIQRVLVADDDHYLRNIIVKFLEKDDIESIEASNGRQALDLYLNDPSQFDAILLDYEMDGLTGCEVCQKVREFMELNDLPSIPIFGVTGHQSKEKRQEGKIAGMTDVLVKPIKQDQLIQALRGR